MRFPSLPFLAAGILLLLSGCLFGGDSTNTAQQLAGVRASYVPSGALVPLSLEQQDAYRNELLPFRNTIRSLTGSDRAALENYLDGTLSLLQLIQLTDEAIDLLSRINLNAPDCGTSSPLSKAISTLSNAEQRGRDAADYFSKVKENVNMSNALGVDYLQNAQQTTLAVAEAHGERVKELKIACGFSV